MTYTRPTDLPPPPRHDESVRPLHVHLHAKLCDLALLPGAIVIMIDNLRASVTMTAALANGASRVVPVLSVEEAMAARAAIAAGLPRLEDSPPPPEARRGIKDAVLLGGERGGVLIEGFDLDNSPRSYTRERVAGRTIVFTTSNGTAALLHARHAAEILVGSFANLSAICRHVAMDPRPVHILCAGTRDQIGLDDCLPAGAMVEQLQSAGRTLVSDDSGRLALAAFQGARAAPGGIVQAMRTSRGGRGLAALGLGEDVDICSKQDSLPVVPRFDVRSGEIRLV